MFQSTRPRGARLARTVKNALTSLFQSTRPRGARQKKRAANKLQPVFQSTRPRGARLAHRPARPPTFCFNPRAHVGRDQAECFQLSSWMFQSTRPRGARPSPGALATVGASFNPRAHVGRDEQPKDCGKVWQFVSIHAPTWGATLDVFTTFLDIGKFQSTRPRGARRAARPQLLHRRTVSIHAPTWGATTTCDRPKSAQAFQSTRPRGARRRCAEVQNCDFGLFQSTRPRGARQAEDLKRNGIRGFNPRAHVGRDWRFLLGRQ